MKYHEIEAEVYYLTTEEGGRKNGVLNGYRGQFHYDGGDHDGGQFFPDFLENEMIELGSIVSVLIRFPQRQWDDIHSGRIKIGMSFFVREGAKVVGRGRVKRV